MVSDNLELLALAEDWPHFRQLYRSAPYLSGNKVCIIYTSQKLTLFAVLGMDDSRCDLLSYFDHHRWSYLPAVVEKVSSRVVY